MELLTENLGAVLSLVTLQNQAMQAMEAQFRQQIKEQLIQSGQDASAASIEKTLAKFRKSLNLNNSATQGLSLTTPSIIAHEIGHQFFIHGIWSSYAVESETQYGSTAPDWLDEAAAILMEDEAHTTSRRDIFRSAYKPKPFFLPRRYLKPSTLKRRAKCYWKQRPMQETTQME